MMRFDKRILELPFCLETESLAVKHQYTQSLSSVVESLSATMALAVRRLYYASKSGAIAEYAPYLAAFVMRFLQTGR